MGCIVTKGLGSWAACVERQATTRPAKREELGNDTAVPARGHAHDMAAWLAIRQGSQATTRSDTALGAPEYGRARPCLGAPVPLGCATGLAGCALGAPDLFLDLVLFLSHCLSIVHRVKKKEYKNF